MIVKALIQKILILIKYNKIYYSPDNKLTKIDNPAKYGFMPSSIKRFQEILPKNFLRSLMRMSRLNSILI